MENTYVDDRTSLLLRKFEALAPYKPKDRKAGKGDDEGWYVLALKEARLLKATYPDEKPELEKTFTSCLSQITRLKKALKKGAGNKLQDSANKFPVITIAKHFGEALSAQFAQYKIQQSVVYREKVEARSLPENRVELDLSPYIKNAYAVLALPENFTWLDLSCALALATGRRMGEIHMSAEFRPIEGESHKLTFTGQLKGKSRKVSGVPLHRHEFTIPTLVPAQLVINGLGILAELDKRLPYESSWSYEKITEESPKVNRRFSKDLNLRTKDEKWSVLEDGMTYHKFRGAYLRAALAEADVDAFDYIDYARSVLGDKDEATIKAYQRFKIKEGSITKI